MYPIKNTACTSGALSGCIGQTHPRVFSTIGNPKMIACPEKDRQELCCSYRYAWQYDCIRPAQAKLKRCEFTTTQSMSWLKKECDQVPNWDLEFRVTGNI